jgi:transposase
VRTSRKRADGYDVAVTISDLSRELEAVRAERDELLAAHKALRREHELLLAKFKAHMRQRFGSKAEHLDPAQLSIPFEDLVAVAEAERPDELVHEAAEAPDSEDAERASKKKRAVRKLPPKELPRIRVEHQIAPEECICAACQQPMPKIGEETREELDYQPASLFVRVHVRPKYACPRCQDGVLTAPPVPAIVEKGKPGPGLLAQVLISKYQDHLPLHRQEAIFARQGAAIARSTMCDWVGASADWLKPLVELSHEAVLRSFVVQADDTPVLCLENTEGRGKARAALWVYVGDQGDVVYDFTPTRSRDGPLRMLRGYEGYCQADAFSGFDELFRSGSIVEIGCMAHARRYFYEALASAPKEAAAMLGKIQRLYRIEREAKEAGLDHEALRREREARAKPILAEMLTQLEELERVVLPRSQIGEAVTYMRRQWIALNRYVEDGRLEIDNNGAERALRRVAVGRKNWLFAGSLEGGKRAAVIYSLIETCKRIGADPFRYLRDVLERLPTTPPERYGELTPRAWLAAQQAS